MWWTCDCIIVDWNQLSCAAAIFIQLTLICQPSKLFINGHRTMNHHWNERQSSDHTNTYTHGPEYGRESWDPSYSRISGHPPMLLPDIEMEPSGRPQGKLSFLGSWFESTRRQDPVILSLTALVQIWILSGNVLFTDYLSGVVREPAGEADRTFMCSYLRNQ